MRSLLLVCRSLFIWPAVELDRRHTALMRRLLLLVLLALPLTAQEARQDETVEINWSPLSLVDSRTYRYATDVMERDIEATSGGDDAIATILNLQSLLHTLPLPQHPRNTLSFRLHT